MRIAQHADDRPAPPAHLDDLEQGFKFCRGHFGRMVIEIESLGSRERRIRFKADTNPLLVVDDAFCRGKEAARGEGGCAEQERA